MNKGIHYIGMIQSLYGDYVGIAFPYSQARSGEDSLIYPDRVSSVVNTLQTTGKSQLPFHSPSFGPVDSPLALNPDPLISRSHLLMHHNYFAAKGLGYPCMSLYPNPKR